MTDLLDSTSTETAPTASVSTDVTTPTTEVQTMTDSTLNETPVIETPIVSAPIETPVIDTVLFVDTNVSNYQDLLVGLGNNVEVVLLTNDQEGVLQMAAALAGRSDLASIQILSHGSDASIEVGSNVLNSNNLANYTNELAQIGAALSATGDILLFGCNVAQDAAGVAFVNDLAAATGADVSASNDLTGLGGNWTLEVASGAIEAQTAITAEAQAGYVGTLTTANAPVFSGISIAGSISSDAAVAYTTHGTAVILDSNVTVADTDSPSTYTGATLTLVRSTGADSADVFAYTDAGSIVSGAVNTSGSYVITFNSTATPTNVNALLKTITYKGSTLGAADINWTFNDQTGDAQATGYSSIFVTGEAPVATAANKTISNSGTTGVNATTTGTFTAISDANSDIITAAVTAVSVVGKVGTTSTPALLTNMGLDVADDVTTGFLDKFALATSTVSGTTLAWTFAPLDAFDELASGQSLVFTYTTKFSDNSSQNLYSTVDTVITISGANDAPTVSTALSDTALVVGNTTWTYNVSSSFSDVDYNSASTRTFSATLNGDAIPTTGGSWLNFSTAGVFTVNAASTTVGDNVIVVTINDNAGSSTVFDTFIIENSNEAIVGITDTDLFVNTSGSDTFAGTYGNTEAVSYSQAAAENGTTGVTVALPALSDSSPAATNVTNTNNGTDSFLNIDNLIGSDYNDTLTGNAAVNVIYGGLGDDTITGSTGNDTLYGGAGDDELNIASGDHVYGDVGTDAIKAAAVLTTATITGGAGADTLSLFAAANTLNIGDTDGIAITGATGTNIDTITFDAAISTGSYIGGTGGVDVINLAGSTTNVITINDALVSVTGGTGNDAITFVTTALASGTVVDGAAGTADSVILPATLNTATFKDVETVTGTAGLGGSVLTITGTSNVSVLAGAGAQTVTSTQTTGTLSVDLTLGHSTSLVTGVSASTAAYSVTNDVLTTLITATGGASTLNITAADATANGLTIAAGTGNITVAGAGTTDTITVNNLDAANQTFTGTTISGVTAKFVVNGAASTSQSITTGSGADTITGGGGADSIVTGDGADVIKFASAVDLAAVTTVDGGVGTADKIYITTAESSLINTSFAKVTGVETLQLTGASTVVLASAANTGAISTVIAGNASTTVTSTGTGALLVDLATAHTPTLITGAASANYTVTGDALTTTIDASTSTGTLLVNAADVTGNAITLATGSGNTTVTGGAAADVYTVTGLATASQTFTGTVSNFGITSSSVTGTGVSISTAAGSDTIVGGAGNDTISSGAESDTITGGAGNDSLNGGEGNDLYLFNTSDVVTGETLVDSGSEAADTIKIVTTTDFTNLATATILTAGHVEQVLITSATTATFTGAQLTGQAINVNATAAGAANLVINVAPSGTVNFSTMTFTAASSDAFDTGTDTVAINVASGTADITGTTLKDTITAVAAATTLRGGDGNDVLNIASGNVVYGDAGTDAIAAAAALTSATITGGAGADTLSLFAGTNTLNIGDTDGIAITGASGAFKDDITFDAAITATSYTAGSSGDGAVQDVITLANGTNAISITDIAVSVVGGTGTDSVTMGAGINVGTFKNIETVTNTSGSASSVLTIQGSSATTVVANAGVSTVTSTSGALTTVDLDTSAGTDLTIGSTATGRYVVTGDASTTVITATGSSSQITYNAFVAATTAIATGTGNVVVVAGAVNDNMTVTGLGRASQIFVGSVGDFAITVTNSAGVGANITTGAGSDTITGGAGNDIISAGADSDTIDGGAGNDTLSGGNGNDTYYVDHANDKVIELSSNTDSTADLISSSVSYTLPLYVEKLTITGTGANFTATGNNLANTITGGAGNDSINGGTGADSMVGAAGNDTYVVDNTGDVVLESGTTDALDVIQSSVTFTMPTNVENMTLTGRLVINGTGNGDANTLIGNISANTLTGDAGNDLLQGLAGNDTLYGGAGQDTLTGGDGVDKFMFDSTYVSEAVVDTITDFTRALKEKIDLSLIVSGGATDAFTFIGTSAFSGLGQLRYTGTSIEGNTSSFNGNTADFTITVTGGTVFTAADFVL